MTDALSHTAVDERTDLAQGKKRKSVFITNTPRASTTQKKTRATTKKKQVDDDADLSSGDEQDGLEDEGLGAEDGIVDGTVDSEKRNKRLVKNRRAAQLFRKRQKQYIVDLEKQVNSLASQNAAYSAKVDLLSAENNLIKDQLGYLRSFISKAVQLSFSNAGGSNMNNPPPPPQPSSSQMHRPTLPSFNQNLLHQSLPSLPLPQPHPYHPSQHHNNNHNRRMPNELMGASELVHHQNSPFERQ